MKVTSQAVLFFYLGTFF